MGPCGPSQAALLMSKAALFKEEEYKEYKLQQIDEISDIVLINVVFRIPGHDSKFDPATSDESRWSHAGQVQQIDEIAEMVRINRTFGVEQKENGGPPTSPALPPPP